MMEKDSDDSLAAEDSLQSILTGSSIFVVGQLLSRGLEFVIKVALARVLGPSIFGVFVFGMRLIRFARMGSQLGSESALLRYLPMHKETGQHDTLLSTVLAVSLFFSSLLAVLLYVFSSYINKYTISDDYFIAIFSILILTLPILAGIEIVTTAFRADKRLEYRVFVNDLVYPSARLLFIGIAIGVGVSVFGIISAVVVAAAIAFLASVVILLRDGFRPSIGFSAESRSVICSYYKFALPMVGSRLGSLLYNNVDIFMLGILASASDVGIYSIALSLAIFIKLPLEAAHQLFPPVVSSLYEEGRHREIEAVYETVTRWTVTTSLFLAGGLLVYRHEILSLFGPEYTSASSLIIFLAVGQLVCALVGPSGYLLLMTDHPYLDSANQIGGGLLNAVLNYLLIIEYGALGAAVATAVSIIISNLARLLQVRLIEGYWPYTAEYWKPLVGVGSAVCLLLAIRIAATTTGLPIQTDVLWTVGIGSIAGASGAFTVISLVYLFGINEQDKKVLYQIRN